MYSSDYTTSSGGSSKLKIQSLTTNGLVVDWGYMTNCDTTSGTIVVTLPTSTASSVGKFVIIKKYDDSINPVVIYAYGSETIDGSISPIYLYNVNDSIMIVSNDIGKSTSASDNRNSTGSTHAFMRVGKNIGQTTGLSANSPLLYSSVDMTQGNGISYDTSTGIFTLQPNKKYKLTASGSKINLSSGGYFYFRWYNITTSSLIGAGGGGDATTSTSSTIPCSIAEAVIEPSVTTTLQCVITGISSVTSIGDGGSPIWAEIEEVSRQVTVLNTVDYLEVSRITSDVANIGANTDLVFNSVVSGNIPYNTTTGIATLTAGKTYELIGEPSLNLFSDASNGFIMYDWVDVTTNIPLISNNQGVGIQLPVNRSASEADSPIAHIIYTPSTNQTVKLRATNNSGTATFRSNAGSKAIIRQIGSTATSSVPSSLINVSWTSFIPTITATTTNPVLGASKVAKCSYTVIGKILKINFYLYGGGTGYSLGSGVYKIPIPYGTIDTNIINIAPNGYDGSCLGTGMISLGASNTEPAKVVAYSQTELAVLGATPWNTNTPNYLWSSTNHGIVAYCAFTAEIPLA